ncbi:ribonuclease H-like domain-containing protein [Sporolactobacillus sp. THM19-2]|uniref:ribonuclease H-like domain-containing protein n=1 Tax=Sporolactobacillus sp. THM19-2 TaxID=2511171 RepID=UPI001021B25A|nr:ribonuclease H-like domain-containing protein [Sporolactobacillus sp. THM19-2]RYL93346.1 hypothetical protein EWH91_05780 [Sporolactobacillus sp. THM19-2]
MSLKQKLQLYKEQLRQAQHIPEKPEKKAASVHEASDSAEGEAEVFRAAKDLNADVRYLDQEFTLVHTERLSLDTQLGPWKPRDLFQSVSSWQSGPGIHPLSAKGLKAEDLLFFDTETTGLASGTGQMIFLIGLARVTEEEVILKQYFLPGPGHEAAFYYAFLSDCRSLKNLVTFNGKAFDWPRVKTRHRFVRDQVPRLPAFGHFDLLHASRRLWKSKLDTVRLQTIEREVLSMGRAQDVPGKMAPFLYFQFLKHPDASLIAGIMEHNREDVLTLISLYIHLSGKVLGMISSSTDEQYQEARWFEQLGERVRAIHLFRSLIHLQTQTGERAKVHLARLYKKEGRYAQALQLLTSAIHQGMDPDDSVYIDAAKLMEHQFKDYHGALDYTQQAIRLLKSKIASGSVRGAEQKMDNYLRRINRLDEKVLREMVR